MLSLDEEIALKAAQELIAAGIPVFAARPALLPNGERDWLGGTGKTGYILPPAWEKTFPTDNWLDPTARGFESKAWRPGWALAAVMGHGLDLLDTDPRSGGIETRKALVEAGLWPISYGTAATPSDGLHDFVAGLGTGSRDGVSPGLDVKSGRPDGEGRGFAFIAPTIRRSKVTGELVPYRWVVPPDTARLRTEGPTDESGAGMAALVLHALGKRTTPSSPGSMNLGPDDRPGIGTPITEARDSTLAAYTASLMKRGLNRDEAWLLVQRRIEDVVGGDPKWPFTERDFDRWWTGAAKKYRPDAHLDEQGTAHGARQLVVTAAAGITMRASRWLWGTDEAYWLPLGSLTLLGGREGIGKSTWAYWIAANVTKGTLPGDLFGTPRSVVICATEDAWAHTVVPRLEAAGADLERAFRVEVVNHGVSAGLTLPVDVGALAEACRERDVSLVLLDPLLGTIDGKLDSHKDAEVRRALEPVSRIAHDIDATIIGLIHQNKGGGDLLTRLMGSRAFAAVARAVLVCAEEERDDPEAPRSFRFGQEKSSLGPLVRNSYRYEIEGCKVGHDLALDKPIWSSRIRIVTAVEERVSDLINRIERESNKAGRPPSKREAAAEWLRDYLTRRGGEAPFREIAEAALAAGHAEQTVRRAALEVLAVEMRPIPGTHNATIWRLSR